ncbi:hypothetical protein BDF19DRAFT_423995 [Syncephalis fuscata]|nr:hypothetical protein BDF19DRAFT_423995 [Syncephalis fuscata]
MDIPLSFDHSKKMLPEDILQPTFIGISVVCGIVACLHGVRQWQTHTRGHSILAMAVLITMIDFILAAIDYNTTYLCCISELLTIMIPTILFAIWSTSMRDRTSFSHVAIMRGIAYTWLVLFIMAAILIALAVKSAAKNSIINSTYVIIWYIGIGINLVGCGIIIILGILLQVVTTKDEFDGKSAKSRQMICLCTVFGLFSILNVGRIFDLLPVYIIPYLTIHIIFLTSEQSIVRFSWTAEETVVFSASHTKVANHALRPSRTRSRQLSISLHTPTSSYFVPSRNSHCSQPIPSPISPRSSQWTYSDAILDF